MELLILSKLKWDLTAITAYDFLDHILERLRGPLLSDRAQVDSLRRHTEHLVSLCATETAFLSGPAPTPPSLVASAALASAIQQDWESQPPEAGGMADIFERLGKLARIEMVRILSTVQAH